MNYVAASEAFLSKSKETYLRNDFDAVGTIAEAMMLADMSYNGTGTPSGWRYQKAVWAKKNYIRKQAQNKLTPLVSDVVEPQKDQDLFEDLRYRVSQLPELQRLCIEEYFLNDTPAVIAASQLNMNKSTFYFHLNKGIVALRKIYARKELI